MRRPVLITVGPLPLLRSGIYTAYIFPCDAKAEEFAKGAELTRFSMTGWLAE